MSWRGCTAFFKSLFLRGANFIFSFSFLGSFFSFWGMDVFLLLAKEMNARGARGGGDEFKILI